MRRWNGWGDDANEYPLQPSGLKFLQDKLGKAAPLPDATLENVLGSVPSSRLSADHTPALIDTSAEIRIRHARGQSLPDWLAMRSGEFEVFPDGVAEPETGEQIRELLAWCDKEDVSVIPYGGGTSVAGHINPQQGDKPVLTLSLARMNKLESLDRESQIATFGAGTAGPDVEQQLSRHGYVLGHFPQSWELSTIGGWVASRSSGQQSLRYGRIEQLFAGGTMETLQGTLELPAYPASSAGPDLREWVMGSEGRMGVFSHVKVRVTPQPEHEAFYVAFLPNWEKAHTMARNMVQARLPLSMLRVSNAEETRTQLLLAGHEKTVGLLEKYLAWRGVGDGKCMVTFGVTGSSSQCRHNLKQANKMIRQAGGVNTGRLLGKKWEHSRFRSPYLRHGLWEHGFAVDTVETATNWNNVDALVTKMEDTIRQSAGNVHVFTHLSHLYPQGSSIYTTYVFPVKESYKATLNHWKQVKQAVSAAISTGNGTISHQHGVGRDHAPWLEAEKTPAGLSLIENTLDYLDPDHRLNPGCLILSDSANDESE